MGEISHALFKEGGAGELSLIIYTLKYSTLSSRVFVSKLSFLAISLTVSIILTVASTFSLIVSTRVYQLRVKFWQIALVNP